MSSNDDYRYYREERHFPHPRGMKQNGHWVIETMMRDTHTFPISMLIPDESSSPIPILVHVLSVLPVI